MYEDHPQTFGVVCLEDLDHEFNGAVILTAESTKTRRLEEKPIYHICHREIRHIKDYSLVPTFRV